MNHPSYRKKIAPPRIRSHTKNYPKRTKNIKSSGSVSGTRRKHRNPRSQAQTRSESLIPSLNSVNLARILNSFYTIRSTVKDLRVTLEKLDRAMDSAYQIFEMAQGFIGRKQSLSSRRTPLRLLPPSHRTSNQSKGTNGIERQPDDSSSGEHNPLASMLQNIDIEQILTIMESPLVQGILKQLVQGENSEAAHNDQQVKEG